MEKLCETLVARRRKNYFPPKSNKARRVLLHYFYCKGSNPSDVFFSLKMFESRFEVKINTEVFSIWGTS